MPVRGQEVIGLASREGLRVRDVDPVLSASRPADNTLYPGGQRLVGDARESGELAQTKLGSHRVAAHSV